MKTHVNGKCLLVFLVLLDLLGWQVFMTQGANAAPSSSPAATIQSMIDAAPDGGTVNVPAASYNESLTVDKNLTLQGASSSTTIIQAISGQRVITVTAGHSLTIQSLTLMGGNPPGGLGGGILFDSGHLQIINCRIANNSAVYGGGVFQNSPSDRVDVIGSSIETNGASLTGGGLYIKGNLAMTDTRVLSNTASTGHGGGLHTDSGHTDLTGGMFSNNRAQGFNGGAVNVNNSIDISGTQFISNTAAQDGGAVLVWNVNQPVNVTNAWFERNGSSRSGGGLWAKSDLTVTNSVFTGNTVDSKSSANSYGGGIYLITGALKIVSSTFTLNEIHCVGCPASPGGGVYLQNNSSAIVQDSLFEKNYGWNGGGSDIDSPSTLILHTTFRGNSGGYGGGLDARYADIQNSDFITNQVVNQGGALAIGQGVTISGTRFISNTGGFSGGGAVWSNGNLTATNTLFAGNQMLGGGAALQLDGNKARTLRHVTIAFPTLGSLAAVKVTSGTLSITNTIITSYTVGISNTGGIVNADYGLFFGGTPTQSSGGSTNLGAHNLMGQDPRFVNAKAGDYHLGSTSPAIGAGTNLGITIDLDGKPRLGRFDIGAYQFWANLFLPLIRR